MASEGSLGLPWSGHPGGAVTSVLGGASQVKIPKILSYKLKGLIQFLTICYFSLNIQALHKHTKLTLAPPVFGGAFGNFQGQLKDHLVKHGNFSGYDTGWAPYRWPYK